MDSSGKSAQVGSLCKNIQLMLEFLKVPFLVLDFCYYTLIIFLMMLSVILLSTFYSKCDQASDLWQQLELASELESDLQETGLWQEMACWFQCWKSSSGFI